MIQQNLQGLTGNQKIQVSGVTPLLTHKAMAPPLRPKCLEKHLHGEENQANNGFLYLSFSKAKDNDILRWPR